MNPIDKFKKPTSLFVDGQTKTHKHSTVEEILLERNGKVENQEVYFSHSQMLTLFPNGYSVLLKQKNSRKYVEIKVFLGLGEVTSSFFQAKSNRKVKGPIAMAFLDKIESLEK